MMCFFARCIGRIVESCSLVMSTLHTPLQWAQRPTVVLITVPLVDPKDVQVKVLHDVLEISATSGDKSFASKTMLFGEVVPEESSHTIRDRAIEIKLHKKDQGAEYWPRLTKEKTKNAHITIDWARWKDEDEVAGKADDLGDFGMGGGMGGGGMGGGAGGMGGMDMQQLLAQMGGMGGGAGAPDFGAGKADSDDEEDEGAPPPLE